ncbi:MAG: indolepyruvate ferredoxin oxidoreductase subunit alpha [Desulfovibrio sp.]|uniref:indolepyruvate ferredoxin oxidoreductase subunit alpha n=1 Tax=Desulfovibrio sp. 7SRBS1 TaxID=3378064 RepID=UPI003B3C949B
MSHPIIAGQQGEVHLLLGNEAIVRGAIEAGVHCVTCYPGTPSSEVPDTFFRLSGEGKYSFEYSTNEKVALEVAGGATLAGAMSLVTMKHVGLNVAADPLLTLTYIGSPGGIVILTADDPGCHSSQNEQDNRYYARMAGMPVFEPATAQEAKDMARQALIMSRKWQQPVLLRTTTRLNHLRGPVEFGPVADPAPIEVTPKNPKRFVPIPAVARMRHPEMVKNLQTAAQDMASSPWIKSHGSGKLGVIATGISRAYVLDALSESKAIEDNVTLLQLGFSYPMDQASVLKVAQSCDHLLILEEGEPILETEVRALLQAKGIQIPVLGKEQPELGRFGEYESASIEKLLRRLTGNEEKQAELCPSEPGLSMRPPNLCAGCPHRATYFSVRQIFGDDAYYSSDIGCYTLGILPPLAAADFLLCMGSSVSAGSGFAKASGKPVVAFIGDSTFFHSGITGLVNAVFNKHNILIVILDNHTTAMTGHQPNPGVEITAMGANESQVSIEAIVKGCGVEHVRTVSPLNRKKTEAALSELKELDGVRVLIARDPCPLHARRLMGKKFVQVAYVAEQTDSVRQCLKNLACPAFTVEGEEVVINEAVCIGCMFCLQVADGIKARKRGA